MRPSAAREVHRILTDTIAPTLASAGFGLRRPGDLLRPVDEGLTQVVSMTVSQASDNTLSSFTLDLAVFVPELYEVRGFPPPAEVPDASGCFASRRLGSLFPERCRTREFWYAVGQRRGSSWAGLEDEAVGYDPRDPASVHRLVKRDLEEAVVPFLAPLRTRRALAESWRTSRDFHPSAYELLVAALVLGEIDAAREMYRVSLADRQETRAWALRAYGVDLA